MQENISGKITYYRAKICLLLKIELFLNSVTFGVISGIKCYQFNEFDASLITLKSYTVRFFEDMA